MGSISIAGESFECPDEVVDLLRSVSEERDELKELARDIVCARLDHLDPSAYYKAMDSVCNTAHCLLKEAGE